MKLEDANEQYETQAAITDNWEKFFRTYKSLEAEAAEVVLEKREQDGSIVKIPTLRKEKAYDTFYMNEINELMTNGKETLVIDYEHLNDAINTSQQIFGSIEESRKTIGGMVKTVLLQPDLARSAASVAAFNVLQELHYDYSKEISKIFRAEFVNIGLKYEITEIDNTIEDHIVSIEGFVTKVDDAQRKLWIQSAWYCANGHYITMEAKRRPGKCQDCGSGRFTLDKKGSGSITNVFQEFELQQRPDKLDGGKMATPITVRMIGRDMLFKVAGGDFVKVDGIVRSKDIPATREEGIAIFYIEASSITQLSDDLFMNIFQRKTAFLEESVKYAIRQGMEDQDFAKCVSSIAPSIYGHDIVKKAIYLQMIGCKPQRLVDGTWFRGDINLFLCGDPQSGKSAIARNAQQIYPRSVEVNAQNVTKVGLTASITSKDGIARLEAGAYLMARGGIVVIDEMQLLQKEEKGSLLEVMDDAQQITIAKGGVKTSRPMRAAACTLALGNPLHGRWDRGRNIYENTGLRPENITRFDAIFVFTDDAEGEEDMKKTQHWLKYLTKGISQEDYENGSENYIRSIEQVESEGKMHTMQYMAYLVRFIKKEIVPKIVIDFADPVIMRLANYYQKMRKVDGNLFAPTRQDERDGIEMAKIPAVGMRQLGALIRFAAASAAAHFRTFFKPVDADIAIEIMSASLASSGFTTTEDLHGERDRGKLAARRLANKMSLTEMDILRRAEQRHKIYVKEWTHKLKVFEKLVKELGFKHCNDCYHTGMKMYEDGVKRVCDICGGYGGFKTEFSMNDLVGYLMNANFTTKDVNDMIEDFSKIGAITPSSRNPSWFELTGEWYSALIKTKSFVNAVFVQKENEQMYAVENDPQSANGNPMTANTAYDMIPKNDDIDLEVIAASADQEEIEKYKKMLESESDESGAEEEHEAAVQEEEEG